VSRKASRRYIRRSERQQFLLEDSGMSRDDPVDEAHIPLALIDEYVTCPARANA
jgi:hypothetical protein